MLPEQDQTTETDTHDTAPTPGHQDTAEAPSMRGAPEGDYDLSLSDEYGTFFDPKGDGSDDLDFNTFDAVQETFREMDLSQHAVDRLTDVYAGEMQKRAQASADAAGRMVAGWRQDAESDPEIGGYNWDSSVAAANRVIKLFGTPELVNDVMAGQGRASAIIPR